jgi:hypothetical protein
MAMIGFKTLITVALVSMAAAKAQEPQPQPLWAADPSAFEAQNPDRDALHNGAMTPAGRMGLELPNGAAQVLRTNNVYSAMDSATTSSCAQRHHSYDPASGTFLGYDGHRHSCE